MRIEIIEIKLELDQTLYLSVCLTKRPEDTTATARIYMRYMQQNLHEIHVVEDWTGAYKT